MPLCAGVDITVPTPDVTRVSEEVSPSCPQQEPHHEGESAMTITGHVLVIDYI